MSTAVLIILGAPLALLLHESAHALVTLALGGTINEFKPWPHKHKGRYYFGRINRTLDVNVAQWEAIAPLFKSLLLAPIWFLAGLWPLAVWECIDAAWWLSGFVRPGRQDATRWMEYRQ